MSRSESHAMRNAMHSSLKEVKVRNKAKAKKETKAQKEETKKISPTGVGKREVLKIQNLGNRDVLFGRGSTIAQMDGNRLFRAIIWRRKKEYRSAGRHTKRVIALEVIDEIHSMEPPGRFLEQVGANCYVVVEEGRIIEKTCQTLREQKNIDPFDKNHPRPPPIFSPSKVTPKDRTSSCPSPKTPEVQRVVCTSSRESSRSSPRHPSKERLPQRSPTKRKAPAPVTPEKALSSRTSPRPAKKVKSITHPTKDIVAVKNLSSPCKKAGRPTTKASPKMRTKSVKIPPPGISVKRSLFKGANAPKAPLKKKKSPNLVSARKAQSVASSAYVPIHAHASLAKPSLNEHLKKIPTTVDQFMLGVAANDIFHGGKAEMFLDEAASPNVNDTGITSTEEMDANLAALPPALSPFYSGIFSNNKLASLAIKPFVKAGDGKAPFANVPTATPNLGFVSWHELRSLPQPEYVLPAISPSTVIMDMPEPPELKSNQHSLFLEGQSPDDQPASFEVDFDNICQSFEEAWANKMRNEPQAQETFCQDIFNVGVAMGVDEDLSPTRII